jgi:hypothetical protein
MGALGEYIGNIILANKARQEQNRQRAEYQTGVNQFIGKLTPPTQEGMGFHPSQLATPEPLKPQMSLNDPRILGEMLRLNGMQGAPPNSASTLNAGLDFLAGQNKPDPLKQLEAELQIRNRYSQQQNPQNIDRVVGKDGYYYDVLENKQTGKTDYRKSDLEAPKPNVLPQGTFTQEPQETKNTWYEQYRLTGTIPPFAFRDVASRNEFVKGYPEYLKSMGIQPTDAVVQKTTYKALSGSLNNQQKVYGMMGSFINNLNTQIERVKGLFEKVDRTGLRLADVPLREWKTRAVGSGKEAVVASYLMEISREIGKLSTGSQASIAELSVEAQKKWDAIHDPNLSWVNLKEVLDATKEQADIRRSSAQQELQATKDEMSNLGKTPKQESGTQQFNVGGKIYNVPANEVEEFKKDMGIK